MQPLAGTRSRSLALEGQLITPLADSLILTYPTSTLKLQTILLQSVSHSQSLRLSAPWMHLLYAIV
jgi:hypothetical protein